MIYDKVFEMQSFQKQYESLLLLSVCKNIPNLEWEYKEDDLLANIDWNNILGIASILCQSTSSDHIDAALRIAQTCLITERCTEIQKNASAYILESLTNHPAIEMAKHNHLLKNNYSEFYSIGQKIESNKLILENTVFINNKKVFLNKFQKEVYKKYQSSDAISISAPTSAGKSFILCQIILEELLSGKKNIVYLVPTRALISQVEKDFRHLISENNLRDSVNLSTVPPVSSEIDISKTNIYVFTQERLHWFIVNNKNEQPEINLLIVDEAHKIDNDHRGILLQQKIEELLELNSKMKVYFSSPFTSNPEILLEGILDKHNKEVINTKFIVVNQNLIYATQVPKNRKKWELALISSDKSYKLGYIYFENSIKTGIDRIAFIASKVTSKSKSTILYCNYPSEAEDVAFRLYENSADIEIVEELQNLIDLVKKTVHQNYRLADVLSKGIAFHYGNMPLLIREEIERLFSCGIIRFLACTSTLLEGVNLPAQSIIIKKPYRGQGNPLTANDFWNLAGRAGRWGKEFSGNIICINPDEWENKPNPQKTKQVIRKAVDIIEEEKAENLLNYIQDDSSSWKEETYLNSAFSYFYIKYVIEKKDVPEKKFYKELVPILEKKAKEIKLPNDIIKRNPGVSPIAQQKLFEYFSNGILAPADFIPAKPGEIDTVEKYASLLEIMSETIANYPHALFRSRAILLNSWMKGHPLALIITQSEKSYRRSNSEKKLSTIIRETMESIETFVRFEFSRDSSCYIDILRYYFEVSDNEELLKEIPELNLWLEFGVSKKTHLSLLSLGLSRSTVIELTSHISDSNLSVEESLEWLKSCKLDEINISPIMIEDIKKVIE